MTSPSCHAKLVSASITKSCDHL